MAEETRQQGDGSKKEQSSKKSVFDKPENSIFEKESKAPAMFKLNLYRPDGNLRSEISKAIFTELAKKYGDLIRCIPSNRWSTMDELCEYVWAFENKSYLKSFTRTRKQIEDGVTVFVEVGAVIKK